MIKTIAFTATDNYEDERSELNKLLLDGYEIISSGTNMHDGVAWFDFVLFKPDDKAISTSNAQWDAITSIEGAETYSKSQNQYFHFWRCQLASLQRVNVFDHPDESRNTYKIAKAAGWDDVFPDPDILEEFETPIPCQVSSDGDWLSLASIMPYEIYQDHFSRELSDIPEWAKEEGEQDGN